MPQEPTDLTNERLRTLLLQSFRLAEANNDITNLIAYITYTTSDMPEFKSKTRPDSQSQIQIANFLQCEQPTVSRRIKYVEKILEK